MTVEVLPVSSWHSLLYAAFFPAGVEDVVLFALARLAIHHRLLLSTCPYEDTAAAQAAAASPNTPKQPTAVSPRGLLLFRVCHERQNSLKGDKGGEILEEQKEHATLCRFLAAACCLRVIERLSLHLWSIPLVGKADGAIIRDLRNTIAATGTRTQHQVVHVLSTVRATWGRLHGANDSALPKAMLLWGPQFFQPLRDVDVAFRVNCDRRVEIEGPGLLRSVDLEAAAGDALYVLHSQHHWEVSMVYHNVEFYLLQENDAWLSGVVSLSPPPPPRCGNDVDVTYQYAAELLRQHISGALRRKEVTREAVKGLVPRVSADRQEIRSSKGNCAMRSALATALCTYAGVGEVANTSECPILQLDPFCGSGTILLESWVQLLDHPTRSGTSVGGVVMGSDLETADVRRTWRNTQADYLAWMAALYGYGDAVNQKCGHDCTMANDVTAWRTAIEERVRDVSQSGSYLCCGADGLRNLLCESIRAPVSAMGTCSAHPSVVRSGAAVPNVGCAFSVLRCDATRVPVSAGSVECIVSDMPFGRRCGSHKVNTRLYPRFLRECYRLLRAPSQGVEKGGTAVAGHAGPSAVAWWSRPVEQEGVDGGTRCSRGGRAVLLTVELHLMSNALVALREACPFHIVRQPFQVDMGGLYPFVFVLEKLS